MTLHRIDLDTLAQAVALTDTVAEGGDVHLVDGTGATIVLDDAALAVLAALDEHDDGYYESIGARIFIDGRDYVVVRYQPVGWADLTVAQQQLLGDVQEAADFPVVSGELLAALGETDAPAGDRAAVTAYLTGRPARGA